MLQLVQVYSDARIFTDFLVVVSLNPMEVTRLSSKGEVIIPRSLRAVHFLLHHG